MNDKISKLAMFTDIHFGKKSNSVVHNQDCINFVKWFCGKVKMEGDVTHIAFLGDWFENRSSINIGTLDMSYTALKMLDELGLPVIFIVGNHDLHRRSTREIHSVNMFNELDNFIIIDNPTVIDDMLFAPYMFESEYPSLVQYNNCKDWAGHFEFKNFMVTGYNLVLKHGPDHEMFKGPNHIFCGHFHKRQANDNVIYIGNTFPMDFGDADDLARGMCFYDRTKDDVSFVDWPDLPTYHKTTLSKIMMNDWLPRKNMRVRCNVDIDISYSEAQVVKEELMKAHELRELTLVEDGSSRDALLGEDEDLDNDTSLTLNELVVKSLESIDEVTTINKDKLIQIYNTLKVE